MLVAYPRSLALSLCLWSLVLLSGGRVHPAARTVLLVAVGAAGVEMGALSWKHHGSEEAVDLNRGSLGS